MQLTFAAALGLVTAGTAALGLASAAPPDPLAARLRSMETAAIPAAERETATAMLRTDLRERVRRVHDRDARGWRYHRESLSRWHAFVEPRRQALARSLGAFPPERGGLNVRVGRVLDGQGFRIENLVYESRPGVFVTANLYLPAPARAQMPGIVIIHSHHNPRTQGELQDMGMTWARQGCMVLIPDQLGYGERRDHRPGSRQDYRFRYVSALQLHAIGESLIGWMAWDVMRGVDLLLSRPGIDERKIVLIGSVAGGGDPAAVVAALDQRITCVVPFNFGGPQPESPYPLPADAEQSFNYMGGGSWESTRNLRLSGRDGFLPWVIVAAAAPCRLIYAHEFSWDRERDPVWKRLQRVYELTGAPDGPSFAHGFGLLSGTPPDASHCNNVGPPHRAMIYPALARWFDIPPPKTENQERRPPEELAALIPELRRRPMHEVYADIGRERAAAFRESLGRLKPERRRARLRTAWVRLLGDVQRRGKPTVERQESSIVDGINCERMVLGAERTTIVPILLLTPPHGARGRRLPVVVGLCQEGKGVFLRERAAEVAALLRRGIAVCLPDVRGTGETSPGGSRERQSTATSISATELMLGQTLLGARIRDLRVVLAYLRSRTELDANRLALWGDSFAPVNPPGFVDALLGEGPQPAQSEPLGGMLALFGALYEEGVHAVLVRGGLGGFEALLGNVYCYVPHDAVIPGALTAGDLCDVGAALAPRALRLEALVDGRNCRMSATAVRAAFAATTEGYARRANRLQVAPEGSDPAWEWLAGQL